MDGFCESRPGRNARLAACALGVVSLLAVSAPNASAHPHVWIDSSVVVRFADKKIASLDVTWAFDEFYSADTIQDYDEKHAGTLDAGELAKLAADGLKSLKPYNYFSYLYRDGKKQGVGSVDRFATALKGNILIYRFTIPVTPPVDPKTTRFAFAIYDNSYYVDIEPAKTAPVTFAGDAPAGCASAAHEDKNDPYYFGQVYPLVVSVNCP